MKYDHNEGRTTPNNWDFARPQCHGLTYYDSASGLSCAFPSVRGTGTRESQTLAWNELCFILTRQKMAKRPLVFPSIEKELVTDLLISCPYAKCVAETKSKHGNYKSYLWIIKQ